MIKGYKVRLIPTKEQEKLMLKSIGCSRFAYNWGINKAQEYKSNNKKYSMGDIRKEFTQLKRQEEFKWLNEVSNTTMVESLRNLDKAYKNYFNKCKKIPYEKRVFMKNGKLIKKYYPKFKSKKKSKQSFYVRCDNLYFLENGTCNIEKIGKVKFTTNYKLSIGRNVCKFTNSYCSYDGKYWYLGFGMEIDDNQVNLNKDLKIGIDLGIKDLAICSNGMVFKNINKSLKVRKLKKKLKRLQRKVSRKYEMNKQGDKYIKTNNIIKLEKHIKLIHRKLSNIRDNHMYQSINTILKERPHRVGMEDLNVEGMIKNKHMAKSIAEQRFYKFISTMKYKCEWNGIEFAQADRWFPSSKTCSNCGHIKKDLKLSVRTYICPNCGLVIDRDLNASINLMNYEL